MVKVVPLRTKIIMGKKQKKFSASKILTYIVYAIVIIFAFFAISAKFSFFGIRILVVKSGSMEPAIKTGSLVIDKAENEYKVGDIVTFKDKGNLKETTTHRLMAEETQNDIKVFTTQGDANGSPDSDKLTHDRILGKVIIDIPYIGYPVSFSRTMPGLIILIIVPATIIIYDEINNVKKEWALRKKGSRKNNNDN